MTERKSDMGIITALDIVPNEVKFHFVPNKNLSSQLFLNNKIANVVAFKIKTTAPKNYIVKPNIGLINPGEKVLLEITALSTSLQNALPVNDKFLIVAKECENRVNSAEEVWKSGNGRGQEQKLRVVYSKDNNNQQNFKEPQQQLEKSGLNRGSNISSTVNSNELFVSMVGRNSEVGAVTSSKLREEKNLNKGQVSYVLSNPIPEKTATLNKDFNQKNEDMQRKIDETEKLLLKVSEERNRYKQEVTQMMNYGAGKNEDEKRSLNHFVLIAVILLLLVLYFSFKS